MDKGIVNRLHKNFEDSVHNEDGVEFWYARDLQTLLTNAEWRNFESVIEKAKIACVTSKQAIEDHFVNVNKMVDIGSGSQREVQDYKLTRYACYLIAQNGVSKKTEIAFAQTYFAIQTRKQELIEAKLNDLVRIHERKELVGSERRLAGIIFERGVDDQGFVRIKSRGDKILFGGNTTQQMKDKLDIPTKRPLADFLPTVTIAAKSLANAITEHNVQDKNLKNENPISEQHAASNKEVRKALTNTGIYPEKLPPAEDIKKVESRLKFEDKKLTKQPKQVK